MLGAIAKSNGTRTDVASKLFNLQVTNGVLGNFSINANGDTTLGTVSFGQMNGQNAKFVGLISPSSKFALG